MMPKDALRDARTPVFDPPAPRAQTTSRRVASRDARSLTPRAGVAHRPALRAQTTNRRVASLDARSLTPAAGVAHRPALRAQTTSRMVAPRDARSHPSRPSIRPTRAPSSDDDVDQLRRAH